MWLHVKDHQALAAAMTAAGATVRGLAAEVGLSAAAVGHLRSGRNHATTALVAERICDALGVELGALFELPDARLLSRLGGSRR